MKANQKRKIYMYEKIVCMYIGQCRIRPHFLFFPPSPISLITSLISPLLRVFEFTLFIVAYPYLRTPSRLPCLPCVDLRMAVAPSVDGSTLGFYNVGGCSGRSSGSSTRAVTGIWKSEHG